MPAGRCEIPFHAWIYSWGKSEAAIEVYFSGLRK
jgi:hypothetical protein